jgi:NADP-dependent 3-hydroxy acid dehydrogenase YdfG
MVEANLLGSMYTVHAALPHLPRSRGAVVQISSTSGRTASAASGVYAAAKSGINAFMEALRQEVTAQGVLVVVIEPGFVSTELTSHITDPGIQAAARSMAESMRTLQPDDIAAAVLYAVTQPEHDAVNEILVRPTDQTRWPPDAGPAQGRRRPAAPRAAPSHVVTVPGTPIRELPAGTPSARTGRRSFTGKPCLPGH